MRPHDRSSYSGSPPPPPGPSSLDQFRAKTVRKKTHPAEIALLWIAGTNLVLLPWAWGGMRPWSQVTSLTFSLLSLATALLPRDYDQATAGRAPFRLYTWPKLFRFPLFWLGGLFLIYGLVGAINPAFAYTTDGKNWWMTALNHIAWLPSGVRVPFERWGPWRMLLIYSSAWLMVCAIWIGFTRRRSFQVLFTTLVANGFLLAGTGMLQQLKGNGKVLWLFQPSTPYFVATIPYKNHAAAYFNLLLCLAIGLSFWHYGRSLRRLDKSSPAGIFGFAATALVVMILFTFSRAGTILMLVAVLFASIWFIAQQVRLPREQRSYLTVFCGIVLLGMFAWLGGKSLQIEQVTERMSRLLTADRMTSVEFRQLAARATWQMAGDQPWYGSGLGSFRFLFPKHQQHYPEIFMEGRQRMYWEHAHNDYAEISAELGIAGLAILLAMTAYALVALIRLQFWENGLVLFGVLGLGLTLAHAWVDFPFQNPAILTTWCVLLCALIRWAQLEESQRT